MSRVPSPTTRPGVVDEIPGELAALVEQIQALPADQRAGLLPFAEEAAEQARFRGRILALARGALEQLRLDLEYARFDLEATRREREDFRKRVEDLGAV